MVDTETPAFIRKIASSIQRVQAPKVAGLDNLVRCVADEQLQFLVLFSSVSAIIPALAVGQSDYAAANAYMDYVATAHAATLPIVSVQWGSWRDAGFGEVKSQTYQKLGLLSQDNREALRFLDRVLARRVAPVIMPVMVEAERWQPHRLMQRATAENSSGRILSTPNPAGAWTASDSDLLGFTQTWLRSLIAEHLKLDPDRLDLDTPLLNYGVDSVMLVQLLRPIGETVGAVLDPSLLFEYPTVASFARWLVKAHAGALATNLPAARDSAATGQDLSGQDLSQVSPTRELQPRPNGSASEIAVVGLSCRFPGAASLGEYWQLLAEGRVAIARIPEERDPPQECYAGLLDNPTHFDPAFFLLSNADARAMDPQALLILEESVNACHHAGYSLQAIKGGRIGVYIGGRSRSRPDPARIISADNPIIALGQNYLAANVSRFLDLRGPSLVVDTACSSALVGMQIAIQSLASGDISAALVGGVSLLDTATLRLFDRRGILSMEPHFHLFDQRAAGALLGEGVGMVVLKTLDQARRDGDSIYAVVKAIAVNNDGRTASPTAPNLQAQQEVMQEALEKAGVRPEDVSHIEVNGSGSEVTDLLELKAIESIYHPQKGRCDLGSMKPNIGHPLSAEGIASFIKVVLMLHHRRLVPFLSGDKPMRHFNLNRSPFVLSGSYAPWDDVQFAAINSFADGGTNAHVILCPWEPSAEEGECRQPIPPPVLRRIDLSLLSSETDTNKDSETVGHEYKAGSDFWTQLTPSVV
jgi:polyketide synthase PksN